MLMGRKGVIGRKGCPSRTEASPQRDPQRAGLDGMGLRAEAEISGESSELIGGASHQHYRDNSRDLLKPHLLGSLPYAPGGLRLTPFGTAF